MGGRFTQPMTSQKRLTHEWLDVPFTKGPKSQGACKNKLLLSKERRKSRKISLPFTAVAWLT